MYIRGTYTYQILEKMIFAKVSLTLLIFTLRVTSDFIKLFAERKLRLC